MCAVAYIGNQGHVGLDAFSYHVGATAAYLFLNSIDYIEAIGEFYLIFMKAADYLCDNIPSHAVVEGTPYPIAVVNSG